jgi:hypothetical protein
LLRPSIVTAVITSRAIDMAHLRAKEGANYVPRHLLTMSCNQSPLAPHCSTWSAAGPQNVHVRLGEPVSREFHERGSEPAGSGPRASFCQRNVSSEMDRERVTEQRGLVSRSDSSSVHHQRERVSYGMQDDDRTPARRLLTAKRSE